MSRLDRRYSAILGDMHAEVLSAAPVMKAAGAVPLAEALAPWAAQIAVQEHELGRAMRAIDKATRLLKAITDGEFPARKPESRPRFDPSTGKANGHDLDRKVSGNGQVPRWHPEA